MPVSGQFSATGSVAKLVVMLAFDVQESQIAGGPNWFASEKWDIDARSADPAHSPEETRIMLQNLLVDRFALRVHRQTEQRPVYALAVSRGGPKFKAREQPGGTNVQITSNSIRIEAGNVARLTQVLATALGRPVVDHTGLGGLYDLSVQWDDAPVPEGGVPGLDVSAPANGRGSIFSALQDQLGLRLEAQRAPVEVIVVDGISRPSPN
jgi:uncharacterized protein (TIGR03435 family)